MFKGYISYLCVDISCDLSRHCPKMISMFSPRNAQQMRDVVVRLFVCTMFSFNVSCLAAQDKQTGHVSVQSYSRVMTLIKSSDQDTCYTVASSSHGLSVSK